MFNNKTSIFNLILGAVLLYTPPISSLARLSSGLVCDKDQLSKDCIACLVDFPLAGQKGICFAETLPSATAAKLLAPSPKENSNFVCPNKIEALATVIDQLVVEVREILVAHAKIQAILKRIETSGGTECSLLSELAILEDSKQTDAAKITLTGIRKCLDTRMQAAKDGSNKYKTSGLFKAHIFKVGDLIIDFDNASDGYNNAVYEFAQMQVRFRGYQAACNF